MTRVLAAVAATASATAAYLYYRPVVLTRAQLDRMLLHEWFSGACRTI